MGLPAVLALQTLALPVPCLVVLAMGLPAVLALLTLALVVPCLLASANARASGQLVRRVWTAHPVLAKLVARKVQLPSRLPSLQTMSPPVQSNPLPAARLVKGCLHMGLPTVLALQALALALVLALSCCQWAPAARLVLAMACIPGRCIARMTGNRRLQTPLGGSA